MEELLPVAIKMNFNFDSNSTRNEGRFRIRDPNEFERVWSSEQIETGNKIIKAPNPGRFIVGILKNNKETALQAVRFDKSYWSEKKAEEWLKNNNLKRISVGKF